MLVDAICDALPNTWKTPFIYSSILNKLFIVLLFLSVLPLTRAFQPEYPVMYSCPTGAETEQVVFHALIEPPGIPPHKINIMNISKLFLQMKTPLPYENGRDIYKDVCFVYI